MRSSLSLGLRTITGLALSLTARSFIARSFIARSFIAPSVMAPSVMAPSYVVSSFLVHGMGSVRRIADWLESIRHERGDRMEA